MLRINVLALLAALAIGSGSAFAQMADFQTADSDGNGSITLEEATAAGLTDEQFASADANSDGVLSQEEYETASAG